MNAHLKMYFKRSRTLSIMLDPILAHLIYLDTPRSLSVAILLRHGEYDQVVSLKINPEWYVDADRFRSDYQATALVAKADWLPCSFDKQALAFDAWVRTEERVALTNRYLHDVRVGRVISPFEAEIKRTRRIIRRVLGRCDLSKVLDMSKWGPGVTSACKGEYTGPIEKLKARLDVSQNFGWCAIGRFLSEHPLFAYAHNSVVCEVRGNQLGTVPKTSKIDRVIAVEPHLNAYLQRGTGLLIKSRLRRVGIDIDIQADVNRSLAASAAKDGYATIDLEAASDSIGCALVELLLPNDWVQWLNSIRSPESKLPDGSWHTLEKHSSMGNGYTFELETLIFQCVALACGSRIASTFGDDIIVEQSHSARVIAVLGELGFTTNSTKTFTQGLFFESCGYDYFDGALVTPFRFKTGGTWISLFSYYNHAATPPSVRRLLYQLIPSELRIEIPRDLGGVGLASDFAVPVWRATKHGDYRPVYRSIVFVPHSRAEPVVQWVYLHALRSAGPLSFTREGVPLLPVQDFTRSFARASGYWTVRHVG